MELLRIKLQKGGNCQEIQLLGYQKFENRDWTLDIKVKTLNIRIQSLDIRVQTLEKTVMTMVPVSHEFDQKINLV